jgi:hypothetical protein
MHPGVFGGHHGPRLIIVHRFAGRVRHWHCDASRDHSRLEAAINDIDVKLNFALPVGEYEIFRTFGASQLPFA